MPKQFVPSSVLKLTTNLIDTISLHPSGALTLSKEPGISHALIGSGELQVSVNLQPSNGLMLTA
jgi:hypothetical protein